MTTTALTLEALKAERQERIAEWFANHRATLSVFTSERGDRIDRLVWSRPGSSIYRIDYYAEGGRLFVCGDLEEATYIAYGNGKSPLAFWASCDLSYFAGKCMASRSGGGFRAWDERIARQRLEEEFAEDESARERWEESGDDDALLSADAWAGWCASGNPQDVFGDDWWDGVMAHPGRVIDQCCAAHLAGLKMAMAQIALARPDGAA